MALPTNQWRTEESGAIKRICSINGTGLVFLSSRRMEMSTEVSLTISALSHGYIRHWVVRGWVVDCQSSLDNLTAGYQVTLLFSELPQEFQQLLASQERLQLGSFIPMDESGIFGWN